VGKGCLTSHRLIKENTGRGFEKRVKWPSTKGVRKTFFDKKGKKAWQGMTPLLDSRSGRETKK